MAGHFAVIDIQFTVTPTGVTIVITTDVPCHLYMRITTQLPLVHLDPYTRRGYEVGTTPRFCFDVYHDNEQEEAGDTYIHTFIKEPWAHCETRYFYLWGYIAEVLSPSESCIFEYHRIEPPFGPPQWIECPLYQNVIGGWAMDLDWDVVQTKDPGLWRFEIGEQVQVAYYGMQYWIMRKGIIWDTSLIPAGSIILQSYMRRLGYYPTTGSAVDFDYLWLNASAWPGTVNPADYAIWNGFDEIVAQILVEVDWVAHEYHNIPLNEAGLAAIVPAGLTKMVAVCDCDFTNEDPGFPEARRFYWYGLQDPEPQILFVEYQAPL